MCWEAQTKHKTIKSRVKALLFLDCKKLLLTLNLKMKEFTNYESSAESQLSAQS